MAAWRHVYIALAFGRYDANVSAMRETTLQPVYDEHIKSAVITPVSLSDDEQRMFVDFELASLAEHRLGDRTDPRGIDKVCRADWKARATQEGSVVQLPKKTDWFRKCFWLLDEGKRVGTIAFSEPMGSIGPAMARCYSFYLLPEVRGRGFGSRVMMQMLQALDKHGFCLRLDTDWTWPRTIRFYRKLGFWVYHWKRELDLIWISKWSKSRMEVGATEASLSIPYDDSEVTLVRAYRKGDKLELEQSPSEWAKDPKIGEAWYLATPTLALELAMQGWPLIRSVEQWEKYHYADSGPPEALAYKIPIWEAYARSRQWIVETPRFAGL